MASQPIHPDDLFLASVKLELQRRASAHIKRHLHSLPAFASEVLGLRLWPRFEEILTTIETSDRVAIRAGRKVSKSEACVAAALWWGMRGGKTLMTSATYSQIGDPLWTRLESLSRRASLPLSVPLVPGIIRFPSGGRLAGRAAAKRENLQGPSGHDSLYIIDEASGVKREIIEAIMGNVAGGGKVIMAGNPTQLSGGFYDAFHRESRSWSTIHISSRESPNVAAGKMLIPGLALNDWIVEQETKHGPESPFVQIHVDGEFAAGGANSVITLAVAQAAEERWQDTIGDGTLHLGVDVARAGDDQTVVYPVRGKRAEAPLAARGTDSQAVEQLVLTAAARHRRPGETPVVNIDVIGVGAGAFDLLKHRPGLVVNAINVAESATDPAYRLLRDQVWFALATWLQEGGAYPPHDETREDMIASTYGFDARGRYDVVSKDIMKQSLGRSPDHADALGLAVYRPPSRAPRVRSLG